MSIGCVSWFYLFVVIYFSTWLAEGITWNRMAIKPEPNSLTTNLTRVFVDKTIGSGNHLHTQSFLQCNFTQKKQFVFPCLDQNRACCDFSFFVLLRLFVLCLPYDHVLYCLLHIFCVSFLFFWLGDWMVWSEYETCNISLISSKPQIMDVN